MAVVVDMEMVCLWQDDELNYWIPQQALELAHTFGALHLPSVVRAWVSRGCGQGVLTAA